MRWTDGFSWTGALFVATGGNVLTGGMVADVPVIGEGVGVGEVASNVAMAGAVSGAFSEVVT